MKVLVATEKPFAAVAVEGIKNEVEAAGHELVLLEKYTEKVWGRHPREIDASWGAQRVKGLNLLKTFANAISKPFRKNNKNIETSLIESFMYPKKGPGQLYEKMASEIIKMGGEMHFNSKVNNIYLENDIKNTFKYEKQISIEE